MTTISEKQKMILIVLFTAIFVASSFYWYKSANLDEGIVVVGSAGEEGAQDDTTTNDGTDTESTNASLSNSQIYVHVKGAVNKPGVYNLDSSQRVIDAVEAAGGALAEGNLDLINLAAKLHDGQEVIVHTSVEEQQAWGAAVTSHENNQSNVGNSLININTATSQQLQTLPGIGPSKAEAIIRYREQNGSFKTIESLVNVGGIGQVTLENLKDSITIQ